VQCRMAYYSRLVQRQDQVAHQASSLASASPDLPDIPHSALRALGSCPQQCLLLANARVARMSVGVYQKQTRQHAENRLTGPCLYLQLAYARPLWREVGASQTQMAPRAKYCLRGPCLCLYVQWASVRWASALRASQGRRSRCRNGLLAKYVPAHLVLIAMEWAVLDKPQA